MTAFEKFELVRTASVKSTFEAAAPANPVEVTVAPVMSTFCRFASPKDDWVACMPAIEAPTK